MLGGARANAPRIFVGTAGWSIASVHAGSFPGEGTHLQRYAGLLDCAEINSSFYRPHKRATYERWAASVPERFRFAVKLPRAITHAARLKDCGDAVDDFLEGVAGLGDRLSVILVQLPPSLAFDPDVADAFFVKMTARSPAAIACEPRHRTWFTTEADALMARHGVARVAADPVVAEGGSVPGGCGELAYFRYHGSPRIYHSDYGAEALKGIAATLTASAARQVWCIFDNTAQSHALPNALALKAMVAPAVR